MDSEEGRSREKRRLKTEKERCPGSGYASSCDVDKTKTQNDYTFTILVPYFIHTTFSVFLMLLQEVFEMCGTSLKYFRRSAGRTRGKKWMYNFLYKFHSTVLLWLVHRIIQILLFFEDIGLLMNITGERLVFMDSITRSEVNGAKVTQYLNRSCDDFSESSSSAYKHQQMLVRNLNSTLKFENEINHHASSNCKTANCGCSLESMSKVKPALQCTNFHQSNPFRSSPTVENSKSEFGDRIGCQEFTRARNIGITSQASEVATLPFISGHRFFFIHMFISKYFKQIPCLRTPCTLVGSIPQLLFRSIVRMALKLHTATLYLGKGVDATLLFVILSKVHRCLSSIAFRVYGLVARMASMTLPSRDSYSIGLGRGLNGDQGLKNIKASDIGPERSDRIWWLTGSNTLEREGDSFGRLFRVKSLADFARRSVEQSCYMSSIVRARRSNEITQKSIDAQHEKVDSMNHKFVEISGKLSSRTRVNESTFLSLPHRVNQHQTKFFDLDYIGRMPIGSQLENSSRKTKVVHSGRIQIGETETLSLQNKPGDKATGCLSSNQFPRARFKGTDLCQKTKSDNLRQFQRVTNGSTSQSQRVECAGQDVTQRADAAAQSVRLRKSSITNHRPVYQLSAKTALPKRTPMNHRWAIALLTVAFLCNTAPTEAGSPDAKRLYDDLLSNYNKLVRPVVNVTDVLTVRIKLKLSQLIDVVSTHFYSRTYRISSISSFFFSSSLTKKCIFQSLEDTCI